MQRQFIPRSDVPLPLVAPNDPQQRARCREPPAGHDHASNPGSFPATLTGSPSAGAGGSDLDRRRSKIRQHLHPGNHEPIDVVVRSLNRHLIGWANYFSFGTIEKARRAKDWYVLDRVRAFLRRRRKVQSRGARKFSRDMIHRDLGVVALARLPKRVYANT